jgi:hypothetical protein
MVFKSSKTGKDAFNLRLSNVSQCVLPGNSKDEVEIQFHEPEFGVDKEEETLVQIRFRFPKVERPPEGEDGDDNVVPDTLAEEFQKRVMNKGILKAITDNIIAEFTQDQGTFVTPRGRYAIQVTKDNMLYLLPSPPLLSISPPARPYCCKNRS